MRLRNHADLPHFSRGPRVPTLFSVLIRARRGPSPSAPLSPKAHESNAQLHCIRSQLNRSGTRSRGFEFSVHRLGQQEQVKYKYRSVEAEGFVRTKALTLSDIASEPSAICESDQSAEIIPIQKLSCSFRSVIPALSPKPFFG